MAAKTIKVKSTGNDSRVLIWEVDDAHPGGEVFISNNQKEVEVGETAAITHLLNDKKLEKVGK